MFPKLARNDTINAPNDSGEGDRGSAKRQPSQGCNPVKLPNPMDSIVDEPTEPTIHDTTDIYIMHYAVDVFNDTTD